MIEFTDEEKEAFCLRAQDEEYDRYKEEEYYRRLEREDEYDRARRAAEDSRVATGDIVGIWGRER